MSIEKDMGEKTDQENAGKLLEIKACEKGRKEETERRVSKHNFVM